MVNKSQYFMLISWKIYERESFENSIIADFQNSCFYFGKKRKINAGSTSKMLSFFRLEFEFFWKSMLKNKAWTFRSFWHNSDPLNWGARPTLKAHFLSEGDKPCHLLMKRMLKWPCNILNFGESISQAFTVYFNQATGETLGDLHFSLVCN